MAEGIEGQERELDRNFLRHIGFTESEIETYLAGLSATARKSLRWLGYRLAAEGEARSGDRSSKG